MEKKMETTIVGYISIGVILCLSPAAAKGWLLLNKSHPKTGRFRGLKTQGVYGIMEKKHGKEKWKV